MEFGKSKEQFTLLEEQFSNVSADRTFKLKHSKLSLDAFWLLIEKGISCNCPESSATSSAVFHLLLV